MSNVEIRGIVKNYGALTILKELDLKVEDGEFLVLLGPSGCGKTTLLNLLAGLMESDGGSIHIDGRDVTDLDPKDRGLAMVFQSYALYPTKTARGNLKFGLSARRLPAAEIERRIAWAARVLQIESLLDRKPGQLSGGQRQRVAIGRALVREVGLFLFDEPLSNLDAKLRTEMRIEIKKLHNQLKNTVVYVTHDQVEAMTMATKIAVMNKGVIEQIAAPAEIYDRPESVFVADFVGSPSMNFINCTVVDGAGGAKAAKAKNGEALFDLSAYGWKQRPREGEAIKVGFRPEKIGFAARSDRDARLDLGIQLVERSGAESVAFLEFSPAEIIAVRGEPGELGGLVGKSSAPVFVPFDALNVFDASSGRRL